jgi:hypothetical protein
MKVLLIFIFLSGCTTFSSTSNKVNPPVEPTTIVTVVEEDIDSYEEIREETLPSMGKILEGFMPSYLSF